MNSKFRRMVTLLLAVVMLFGMLPLEVFAQETNRTSWFRNLRLFSRRQESSIQSMEQAEDSNQPALEMSDDLLMSEPVKEARGETGTEVSPQMTGEPEMQMAVKLAREPENQYDKLNWNHDYTDITGQDHFWQLNQFTNKKDSLPYQTLATVGQPDPIKIQDINYRGYFYNEEGRLVLRLTNDMDFSSVSGPFKTVRIRLDKALYEKVDLEKSVFYRYALNNSSPVGISTLNAGDYEIIINYSDANPYTGGGTNNIPIDLVMKKDVTLDSLMGRDYFIQSRVTSLNNQRVRAYAPRGSRVDYSSYTSTAVIPFKTNIDEVFLEKGRQETGAGFTDGPTMINKTMDMEYNPYYGRETASEKDTTAQLKAQYHFLNRTLGPGTLYPDGKVLGFVMGFDKILLDYLVTDDTNKSQSIVGSTQLLDQFKKPMGTALQIKYENIIVEGDTAYVVFVPNSWKQSFNELGLKNIEGNNVIPVTVPNDTLIGYLLGGAGGQHRFANLDLKIDNEKVTNNFYAKGINYISFGGVAGFIQENQGWLEYELEAKKDVVIPHNGTLDLYLTETINSSAYTNRIAFQIGEGSGLIHDAAGYYRTQSNDDNNAAGVKALNGGLTQSVVFLGGQTIRKGDTLKATITHNPDYKGEIIWWDPEWTENDGQDLQFSKVGKWNISGRLDINNIKEAKVTYVDQVDKKEKYVNITKPNVTWQSSDKNIFAFGTAGRFTLYYDNIDKGSDLHIDVTYSDGSVKRSTVTNMGGVFKQKEVYKKPYFIDGSKKVGAFIINKATYMPMQDVFTNDYSGVTTKTGRKETPLITDTSASSFNFANQKANKEKIENFNPLRDNFDLFMTDLTDVRGYSLYQNASVAQMLVPRGDGTIIQAKGVAFEDEVDEREDTAGEILTDMSTKIKYEDVEHTGWLYSIQKPDEVKLVKDLKLLFANTTSSSLLSDWKTERVRVRVLFDDNKDFDFNNKTNTANGIVKIVPDAEKYYQEADYKVNGFSEASGAKFVDGLGQPLTGNDLAIRQWPGNLKAYTDNTGITRKFLGWATGKVDADKFAELPILETVDQWNDVRNGTKVYRVTEDSPIDTHQVIYAVWGEGLKVILHSNNGKDIVHQIRILESDFKDGKAVIDMPEVPHWTGDIDENDPDQLKEFVKSTTDAPRQTFMGWAATSDDTNLKLGYNLNELAKEDNGLDTAQIQAGAYKSTTIMNSTENGFTSTNLLLPNTYNLVLEGNYQDWLNGPDIELYAHYRPFFDIDVTKNYKLVANEESSNPSYADSVEKEDGTVETVTYKPKISLGLLYSSAITDYDNPTITKETPYSSIKEGSYALEGLEGYKMQTVGENEPAKFIVPGYDVLGQRYAYTAVETPPGAENLYYNFDGSWGKLGISIYGQSEEGPIDPANNSKRISKLQMVTVKPETQDGLEATREGIIDTFSGATVRSEKVRQGMAGKFDLLGYTIAMYNVPREVPKPAFETIYDGVNSFKLNAKGLGGGVVDGIRIRLADNTLVYFDLENDNWIPKVVTGNDAEGNPTFKTAIGSEVLGTLTDERPNEDEHYFTFKLNSGTFTKGQNISAVYYKGGLAANKTGEIGATTVQPLPVNKPVTGIAQLTHAPLNEGQTGVNARVEARIPDLVPVGTEYTLVKEDGTPITGINGEPVKYKVETLADANRVVVFPAFNCETNHLEHGDKIKIITSLPAFGERVADVASEPSPLILEGPLKDLVIENDLFNRWMNLGVTMQSEDHVAVGEFKIEISFKDETPSIEINNIHSTEELTQTLRELYRDDNIDKVIVVASDKYGNENSVDSDYDNPRTTPIRLNNPRVRSNAITIKGEANAFVTITITRGGQKIVNDTITLQDENLRRYELPNGLRLEKGDSIELVSVIREGDTLSGKIIAQSNPSKTRVR